MSLDWALDATVGGVAANSYISLENAELYFSMRSPAAPNWSAETSDTNKSKALITATRLLDQLTDWDGETATEEQALAWPRSGLYNAKGFAIEEDELPEEVGWSVCEFAEALLAVDRTADLSTEGISSLSVGSVSIEFNTGAPPSRNVVPEAAWDFVSRWGTRRDSARGAAQIVRA